MPEATTHLRPASDPGQFGCLGAPTKVELLHWRDLLTKGEIHLRGIPDATALSWLDEQLARYDAAERN